MAGQDMWTQLGAASDVPPGTKRGYQPNAGPGILVVNCDGRLYAIEDRCTHDDGPLAEGRLVDGCQVECPRHGARFDAATGRALTLPAIRPVASFPVRVSADGMLEADLTIEPPPPPARPRRGGRR